LEQLDAGHELHAGAAEAVDAAVVARALALLDQGRVDDARDLLADALADARGAAPAPAPAFEPLADAELEHAFEDARPETEQMIDADGIAFEAIVRAKLDEPESVSLPAPDSPFHTLTMAELLERQGDREGARAIRSALASGARDAREELDADAAAAHAARERTIQTLERWLARLRGGDA
jgi:hypothetical protein